MGAWFEADIVKIEQKLSNGISNSSDNAVQVDKNENVENIQRASSVDDGFCYYVNFEG